MAANAKERLELALEASNEGIWDWDFESGALDVTPRVAEFFQCQREEVPNFFVELDLIHSDERESFKAAVAAIRAGESDFLSAEPRIYCEPDKEWKWFRVRGVAVCFEGKVKGIAGSLIDISGRKEAELALLEEQHLTRTLIENVPLQIYFKDLESKFVMVNTPMAQWIGKGSPDEIVGKSDKDFFEEEHWRQALEDEKEIMETGKAQESYIEREIWAGKEETWVLTTKMPYRGPRGTLLGTFGVSSDVTELVQTQKSLAELAAELKQRNQAYEEEVSLAREIQQGLLPREYPEVNTAKFGHRYLPISGLAGDFFEVFKLGENKVALLICDVMGHGVRSALVASLLRGLISQARDLIDEPAKFLNALNQGLVDYLSKAQVTMLSLIHI